MRTNRQELREARADAQRREALRSRCPRVWSLIDRLWDTLNATLDERKRAALEAALDTLTSQAERGREINVDDERKLLDFLALF